MQHFKPARLVLCCMKGAEIGINIKKADPPIKQPVNACYNNPNRSNIATKWAILSASHIKRKPYEAYIVTTQKKITS